MQEKKLPGGPVGMGATSMAEVRAVGIAMFVAVLDSLGMSVAKKIDVQNSQRIVLGNCRKKRRRRSVKDNRQIRIASFS